MNRETVLVADCPNSLGGITVEPVVVNDCGISAKGRIDEMVTGDCAKGVAMADDLAAEMVVNNCGDCARAGEGERAVNVDHKPEKDGFAEDASVLRILADSDDRAELIVER